MELEALCMSCREEGKPQKRMMSKIELHEKKGRYSAKGKCTTCEGNMFKFLSKVDAEKMAEGGTEIIKAEEE
jgi:hypothetical protein